MREPQHCERNGPVSSAGAGSLNYAHHSTPANRDAAYAETNAYLKAARKSRLAIKEGGVSKELVERLRDRSILPNNWPDPLRLEAADQLSRYMAFVEKVRGGTFIVSGHNYSLTDLDAIDAALASLDAKEGE